VFIRDMLQGETRRVSKGAGLGEPNSWSGGASITPDGKYVAFHSGATNMVPNDGNGHFDAFRWDRDTHDIVRISVGPGGVEGNGDSHGAAMSADGSRIAFVSDATNFLANDANGTARDVFLRDLTSQTTTLVSRATGGAQSNMTTQTNLPSISANGSRVAFTSYGTNLVQGDGNGKVDAFVRNVDTAQTRRVSVSTGGTEGNGDTSFASISPNGSYVAIVSEASNLVQGDGNGVRDVFVRYG
jgi:Tol biopolymer transport system component